MKSLSIRLARPAWRRASYCAGGECAEITERDGMIIMRNSQRPRRVVRYTAEEWHAFAEGLRSGEFNDLG